MSRLEQIEAHGIALSDRTKSTSVLVETARSKGIIATRSAVSKLRSGTTSGDEIARRLEMAHILETGKVARKDSFYFRLASEGLEIRRTGYYPPRFTSTRFMEQLSEKIGEDSHTLDRCFVAMRMDLTSCEPLDETGRIKAFFDSVVETYLNEYSKGPKSSPTIRKLNQDWGRDSIATFYQDFYDIVSEPMVAKTFPPYEVEIFKNFYLDRLFAQSPPSPFDRTVLLNDMKKSPVKNHVGNLRYKTGIKYRLNVHKVHSNVLVHGNPNRD